jgi:hypothetical protein
MKLLVFAHRAEASAFTQNLECRQILNRPELWLSKQDEFILITGEGRIESMLALSHTLSLYPEMKTIFNFGIAGALNAKLKRNEIHPVKIAYAHNGAKPIFQSFPLNASGIDCLTTDERILSTQEKEKLAPLADLLDRELWGLAMAAKHHHKELKAFKIISDILDDEQFCERIKQEAQSYSHKLFEFYQDNFAQELTSEIVNSSFPELYLTKSMQHKLEMLLHSLMIKHHLLNLELTYQTYKQKFSITHKLDKTQTLHFLHQLEIEMNPLRHQLEQTFKQRYLEVTKTGANVSHDPKWEAKYLDLSIRITSVEQLEKFKQAVMKMNYQDFLHIMQGATLHADQ